MPPRPASRARVRRRLVELRRAALPIGQAALAAGGAWLVATELLGHRQPFFAPIAAIICLGAGQERTRRTLEVLVGVALGIAVGDLLVAGIGGGAGPMVLVVALAMAAAVLVGGGPLLVTQAGVSAVLVAALQPAQGLSGARFLDALAGGLVGLLVSIALPLDPLALVRRALRPLAAELADALEAIADALGRADRPAAEAALARARAIDGRVAAFHGAVAAARETARIAPPRWLARAPLAPYAAAAAPLDLAVRDVRALGRGALRPLALGEPVPAELCVALRELAATTRALPAALGGGADAGPAAASARATALRAAGRATRVLAQAGTLAVAPLVGQVRSTAIDLLRALGMSDDAALAAVRAAADGPGAAAPPSAPPPRGRRPSA